MSLAKTIAARARASAAAQATSTARKVTSGLPPRAVLPKQLPKHSGKMTVVLDIDETLIHSKFSTAKLKEDFKLNAGEDASAEQPDQSVYPNSFYITLEGFSVQVNKRPHLDWFLKEASQKFELVTFTAGVETYAQQVLKQLDPTGELITHSLFRQHCTKLGPSEYTKDLSHMTRNLARTVLVDNNPICFLPQPENGIPVGSFYDQQDDNTLPALMKFLDGISGAEDVRPHLTKVFKLHERAKMVETRDVHKAML